MLPLFRKKGLASDARLRSIPVFSYGGPLAGDARSEAELIDAARDLAAADGAIAGITINTGERRLEPPDGFVVEEILPRWIVELPEDLATLRAGWRKTSNNLFRSLAKSDRAGIAVRLGTSRGDLRSFHRMYVATMKKHRSLPRTMSQLRLAQESLGDCFRLFLVSHEGRDVAGGAYHVWGDTIELLYNGSDDGALQLRPNHALYWHVMEWASDRGLRRVDLGGAYGDTPLADFKRQWGATPRARFRLTYRAGAGSTRAESLAAVGYGAGESERRIVGLAWRWVPTPLLRAGAYLAYRYA